MKVNVELAIFFALLLVIAGTFLLLQQTTSITGAVITTLPTEETTLVESSNASSEQAVTIITETYAEPETIKKETSSIGIQGITIQNAPSIALVLNTTDISKNDTDTNLTAYNTTQTNGNSLKVIYNWLMNNSPIAVLNMPFEGINGTSGTTADNKTWDYSGLRNHGNETGGVLWNSTGGYDGKGAYMFDGANDYIGLSDNNSTRLACTNGCTINSWVYIKGKSTSASAVTTIVSRLDNLNNFLFFGTLVDLNRTYFIIYENKSSNSKLCSIQSTTNAVSWNSWVFVTGRYNLTHAATFIDGAQAAAEPCVLNSFTSLNATTWDNETPYNIGRGSGATSNVFNGTIDEVMIFNRSLSNEQIYALWRNQTNVITAQETILGENWSVHATPNNGTGDGTVVISNNLTILDKTPPNVTINFLNNPADNSNFSIRSSNQTFNASVFDSFTQISTVYFQFDNGTSADVNVTGLNTSGQWTVSYNVSTLAEGKQGVRIIANDTVNNINNSAVINFTVDFTSPNVTINSLNANTLFNASNYSVRSGNVTFNASAFDTLTDINRLFFWLDNGTGNDINITGINNSGQWTISYNVSALAEGRQGVRIVANDTVNNVNDSAIINFTVDFTGPNVTINSLNANTLFNASNFSVRSGNVTFNVSIFDALTGVSRVYFWLDNGTGNDINVTAVNQSGNWIVSYNVSTLAEGRQGVRIIANDTVNNVNDTYFMNFTVDFTSPNVTINSINANTLFNASNYSVRSGNVTFNASAFDTLTDINKLFFWLDNGTGNDINITGINNSGQWTISYNVSTLAEEKQGVRIIANDTVNNINDTYFMNFTVDFTSPNVTRNFLNNPVNDSNFSIRSSNQTFNASVFDSLLLLDTVYFWFDNGTSQDFNITGTNISGQWIVNYNLSTLAEGRQGVRIVANDTVNNVNDSAVINFTIDFTAPTVNITGPAAGATVSGIRNFNATVRDSLTDVGKVLFQFSNGTNPFNLTASNTSGMWNVSINTNSIVEGGLTITVFANDTVGNINNTKTLSLTVDNIAEPGSGGGGPSSSTSTSTTNIQASEQKEWASLEIGEIATLEVKDKEIGITEISFTVSEEAYDVTLRVAKISYLPSSVSTFDGYAYQKLDISTESALAKDIFTEATIKFKVEKAWLADNQIAKEEVALYHYVNDKWITLPTKVGKDDNKYVYYSSKTPSFSYFVIGKKSSKEVLVKEPVEMPKEPPVSIPLIEPAETVKSEEGRLQKIFRSAEQLFVKTGRGLVALSKEAAEMSKTIAKKVITSAEQLFVKTGRGLVALSKEAAEMSKTIAKKVITSVTEYTIYWLLTLILIVILLIALHIKDLPVPEFLWKLKQAPQVNVEEPIALPSPTEQKTDIHLRDWGKKNYIDLQQELKRVDALIKETPLPEQKNKALKLTALKTMQTQQKQSGSAVEQQKAIQKISPEETEQWAAHLLTSGTPAHQVVAIVHRATALNEAEIKAVLVKIRATQLLQKTYALTQKDSKELQEFIRTERKKGATIEQIIADLVREGWNERIVRLYVKAHYLVSPKCT